METSHPINNRPPDRTFYRLSRVVTFRYDSYALLIKKKQYTTTHPTSIVQMIPPTVDAHGMARNDPP